MGQWGDDVYTFRAASCRWSELRVWTVVWPFVKQNRARNARFFAAQKIPPKIPPVAPGVDIIVTTLPRWGWAGGGGGLLSQEAVMTQ